MADPEDALRVITGIVGGQKARTLVRVLTENGYVVAPREPIPEMIVYGSLAASNRDAGDTWRDMMDYWLEEADG